MELSPSARFPVIEASTLTGQPYVLPTELEGRLNLVLIAFWDHQQPEIDAWLALAPRWQKQQPDLRVWELPVVEEVSEVTRFLLENGLRGMIQDREFLSRTMVLYVDKSHFREALQLPNEEQSYALLIDRSGKVGWRAHGPPTPETIASLTAALAVDDLARVS